MDITSVTEISICHGKEEFTITMKTVLVFHLLRNLKFDGDKGVPCLFPNSLSSWDETWIDIQKRVKVTWVLSSCLYTFLYLYTNTIFRPTLDNSILESIIFWAYANDQDWLSLKLTRGWKEFFAIVDFAIAMLLLLHVWDLISLFYNYLKDNRWIIHWNVRYQSQNCPIIWWR